jgi:hypothetical protein
LLIAALWTIPAGVAIGLNARRSAAIQPIVQVVASVPATALFPIIILLLARIGGGLAVGSIVLMLLGTQWYILFNVIAGASALPTELKEVCGVFRFSRWERWRRLILPGIFPYLITGFVTASGCLEREHPSRILPFEGPDVFNDRIRCRSQWRCGQRELSCPSGRYDVDGAHRSNDQPPCVAWLYTLASTRFRLDA